MAEEETQTAPKKLFAAVGFLVDHVEVKYDDTELKEQCEEAGIAIAETLRTHHPDCPC